MGRVVYSTAAAVIFAYMGTSESPSVLPDPALEPTRPGEPPVIDTPEPPDPAEPWNEPDPPEPPTPRPPELPPEPDR